MALLGDVAPDFRPDTLRGPPGLFRVGRTPAGQWWLVAPEGRLFFARGVHGVRAEADSPHDPAARLRAPGLTTVERVLRHGRLALGRAIAHSAVVGYCWSQWADRAGEQPPFAGGLVHANDAEVREHTELLTGLNLRVEELRHLATVQNQESP